MLRRHGSRGEHHLHVDQVELRVSRLFTERDEASHPEGRHLDIQFTQADVALRELNVGQGEANVGQSQLLVADADEHVADHGHDRRDAVQAGRQQAKRTCRDDLRSEHDGGRTLHFRRQAVVQDLDVLVLGAGLAELDLLLCETIQPSFPNFAEKLVLRGDAVEDAVLVGLRVVLGEIVLVDHGRIATDVGRLSSTRSATVVRVFGHGDHTPRFCSRSCGRRRMIRVLFRSRFGSGSLERSDLGLRRRRVDESEGHPHAHQQLLVHGVSNPPTLSVDEALYNEM